MYVDNCVASGPPDEAEIARIAAMFGREPYVIADALDPVKRAAAVAAEAERRRARRMAPLKKFEKCARGT